MIGYLEARYRERLVCPTLLGHGESIAPSDEIRGPSTPLLFGRDDAFWVGVGDREEKQQR